MSEMYRRSRDEDGRRLGIRVVLSYFFRIFP